MTTTGKQRPRPIARFATDPIAREGRKQSEHEAWLAALPCPVLRLDSTRPLGELVEEIADWLLAHEANRPPWADDRKSRQ